MTETSSDRLEQRDRLSRHVQELQVLFIYLVQLCVVGPILRNTFSAWTVTCSLTCSSTIHNRLWTCKCMEHHLSPAMLRLEV